MCKPYARIMLVISLFSLTAVNANPGDWTHVPIFPEQPLETKLGTFGLGSDPDALAMILWNDGNSNRLDAVTIPPPYDGTGLSSTALEDTATLFSLGDICTIGTNVLVPYIKDFNVEVARFNGSSWSTSTLPGTVTNNFDSADCGVTNQGAFIMTHDLTDSETEVFQTTNAGNSYTFYARYASSGPFDGAVREPFATNRNSSIASSIYQLPTGLIRSTVFDTAQNPPNISHMDIIQLPPPPGMFTFVRESAARMLGGFVFYTYNADGNARTVEIPLTNPSGFTQRNLGAVNNNGSQFTFQSGSLLPVPDESGFPRENNVLWDDYFVLDPPGSITTPKVDTNYPLSGVGGPVDGCLVEQSADTLKGFFVGSNPLGNGTDLLRRELEPNAIFTDGFESGDVSAWSSCN